MELEEMPPLWVLGNARMGKQTVIGCGGGRFIDAMVTFDYDVIRAWIMFVLRTYKKKPLVVGLAIKWRRNSNNPVVTLCIGYDCLVIQTLHAALPPKLFSFLADPRHIFVGFGVDEDAKKLRKDFNLVVECVVDLRDLEPPRLKFLVSRVVCIELEMEKRWRVTLEDCEKLSIEQVQNACIDAYLSCEIGRMERLEWHSGFQQIKKLKEHVFAFFKPKTMRDYIKKDQ